MKVAAIVLTLVAVVKASVIHQAPVALAAPAQLVETGSSRVARTEDNLGNYAFGYDEIHTSGGSFRREQATNGGVTGSYGLRDADGRIRTVNYIADAAGFRVAITSNEPGVLPKDSAGALVNNGEIPPGPVVDETPVLVAAPAAPVVAAAPAHLAAPAHQQILAAPAHQQLLAAPAHQQILAAPAHQQILAAPAQISAPAAFAPLPASVNGPLVARAAVPSAPVLATPTGHGVPTVLSNPLLSGPFAPIARPAISTPHALATGPLASPLTPGLASPLAAPLLAGPGPQLVAQAPQLVAQAPQLVAQAPQLPLAAPTFHQRFVQAPQQFLAAPAPVAVQAPVAQVVAAAPALGYQYQTQITHLAPQAPLAAAPVVQQAAVKGY